jgi:hypothetical protein
MHLKERALQRLALAIGDDRSDSAFGEVDVLNLAIAGMELLANGKVNAFKVGFEQTQIGARETRQNMVWRHVATFGAAKRGVPEPDDLFDAGRITRAVDQSFGAQQAQ